MVWFLLSIYLKYFILPLFDGITNKYLRKGRKMKRFLLFMSFALRVYVSVLFLALLCLSVRPASACTTNTITISKSAPGATDGDIFSFEWDLGNFDLYHNGPSFTINPPGTYEIVELLSPGWVLDGIDVDLDPDDPNTSYQPIDNGIEVTFSGVSPVSITFNNSPVPIPGAIWLLGSGLVGLVGFRKKFKK